MTSHLGLKPAVIDANLPLAILLALPGREQASELLSRWWTEGRPLYVPGLWQLEIASGLRKAVSVGWLTQDEAHEGLRLAAQWAVQVIAEDMTLVDDALRWAARIGQRVIYDSIYLALAERLKADFWTADRKLYRQARVQGANFVHLLGEK